MASQDDLAEKQSGETSSPHMWMDEDGDVSTANKQDSIEVDQQHCGAGRGHPTKQTHPRGANQALPDIDHYEIAGIDQSHELDLELARTHNIEELKKIETRGSIKSKISQVLSRRKISRNRLDHDELPLSDLGSGVVGWDSQDDPAMPLNFSKARKWVIVGLLSAITFLTPFASSILAPGVADVDVEFGNSNSQIGSLTVSIYLLGYVVGPLFLAPLSEIYGRRPIMSACNVLFCAWQIGCALAPTIASLIVFRFLAGVGGAGCLALGAGIISDVFHVEERGFAIGMYTLGPLIGPSIGPLIGGFIAASVGWRWDFWIVLIVGGLVVGATEMFTTETNPRVLIDRKVARLKLELGRDDLRSCYEEPGSAPKTRARILMNGLVRPTKMLYRSAVVLLPSLYIAFLYGTLYLLFTTIPVVFKETYGWSVGITGLVNVALGLGFLIGWLIITLTADQNVVRRTRLNNGVFEPEFRLPICLYYAFLPPITFFWYGWSTQFGTHWIVPILGLLPYGVGIVAIFMPMLTYLIDCYPLYAASAAAANTVLRSLVGALLPLAGPKMYATLGLGWGNSLLGFICIAMIPVPALLLRYGKQLRARENLGF